MKIKVTPNRQIRQQCKTKSGKRRVKITDTDYFEMSAAGEAKPNESKAERKINT